MKCAMLRSPSWIPTWTRQPSQCFRKLTRPLISKLLSITAGQWRTRSWGNLGVNSFVDVISKLELNWLAVALRWCCVSWGAWMRMKYHCGSKTVVMQGISASAISHVAWNQLHCCANIFWFVNTAESVRWSWINRGYLVVSSLHRSNFGFAKSSTMLGSLGPITRARVLELWADDPDKQPSATQRVHDL